jgi:hypothetical protein
MNMNKIDTVELLPDSNCDAIVVDGVFHLQPKDQLALRNSMSYIVAASCLAGVGVPTAALTVVLGMYDWTIGICSVWAVLFCCAMTFIRVRRPQLRAPLAISRDGQIAYRGKRVRPSGLVAIVRAYRIDGGYDCPDTLHVECIDAAGRQVELPRHFFKNAEAKEIAAIILWLSSILGASPKDDMQVFAPRAVTRKRSPAQGGHAKKPSR